MSYYISDHGKDCTCWTCNFGRNKEFFELIHKQKSRIAELEAEVERLRKTKEIFDRFPSGPSVQKMQEAINYITGQWKIKQQSATDFEEGEG